MYNDLKIFIVCENYDDYLAKTLPLNIEAISPRFLSRHVVIVTDPGDRKTWDLAEAAGCIIVLSSRIHQDGAPFAKGKAINDAVHAVDPQDWILLIDADIILPLAFNSLIDLHKLDKDVLYYATRKETGKRDETKPYGYFQLFNINARWLKDREILYPEKSRCAAGDDDRFGMDVFPSDHKKKISFPFFVRHLHHGKFKKNWNGRKSARIVVNKNK